MHYDGILHNKRDLLSSENENENENEKKKLQLNRVQANSLAEMVKLQMNAHTNTLPLSLTITRSLRNDIIALQCHLFFHLEVFRTGIFSWRVYDFAKKAHHHQNGNDEENVC